MSKEEGERSDSAESQPPSNGKKYRQTGAFTRLL